MDGFALFANFAIGTTVTIVFVEAAVYTANVPLLLGGITSGVKTISITVKDGFGGNVRKPNEFLGAQLGALARSVYTGFAVQMGPVSVLGAGFLFAGMTVALSKLLRAFWYGGGQENYYTKSLNPELPDKGYRLVPGGMQFPQGAESGIGNREVGAFLMNLWQISGRNQMFLPGNRLSELEIEIKYPLSIRNKQHINKHNLESIIKQSKYLTDVQLSEKLEGSFFNPEWSTEDINRYAEQAYNMLRIQGKTGNLTFIVNGEVLDVFIHPDGRFGSVYGRYTFTVQEIRNMER